MPYYPKHWYDRFTNSFLFYPSVTTKYNYSYYNYKNDENTVKNTYSFVNANLYYQQKDSKWEFKISANNLTNNTSMNTDSYNEISDSNTTSLYFIQPRLYLFSVKYNL